MRRSPNARGLRARLEKVWNYERFGIPAHKGATYFFSRNTGLQNQSVIYATDSLEAEPKVLIDPNAMSAAGTVALTGLEPSHDGALVAYGVASAGSDWQEWKVREVATGKDRGDLLKWVKFSGASWSADNAGFYYGRFPEPGEGADLKAVNYHQKLYYHKLGTPQSEDRLVHERPDHKEWQFHGQVTDDGRYLIITVSKGTDDKYRILYQDLKAEGSRPVELVDNFDHEYTFIDNDGPVFWFKTDRDAPRGRVVAVDTAAPGPVGWKEVIPQAEATLTGVGLVGGQFLANYLKDAKSQVKAFDLTGRLVREVDLPGVGTAAGFDGERSDRETFYSFTTYTSPSTVYRYDVATGQSTVFRKPKVDFDPSRFETKQVFHTGNDGARIPMFLSHKKGLKLDGSNPTHLYGYGGFNIALTPSFHPENVVWMEMGGVFAVANLRGGGRVRRALAQGRHRRTQAERLRRLHRRGAMVDRQQVHVHAQVGDQRAFQRRPARGCLPDAAARPLRRDAAGRRGARHAPVPQVHDRLGVGGRLRLVGRPRPVSGTALVLAAAQDPAGDEIPADAHHHGRPRRSRGARAQLQVRRGPASRARRSRARAGPHRDLRRPRRGQADGEDHRGIGRPLGIPRQDPENDLTGRLSRERPGRGQAVAGRALAYRGPTTASISSWDVPVGGQDARVGHRERVAPGRS